MTGAKYFADTLSSNGGNVIVSVGSYNGWYRGLTYQLLCPCVPAFSSSTPPSSIPSPELHTLSLSDAVSNQDKEEAARLKAEGNKAFAGPLTLFLQLAHDFPAAARLYSEAIEKNPHEPTIWCNRAYARMKLEEYGYALSDASHAIKLDPQYTKAYYRRATCYMQILKPQAAVQDFKRVLAIEPKNESVRAQMVSTQKLIRRIEFEKAIEVEDEKDAVQRCLEMIAEGGCEVDKAYTGPKLEEENGRYNITHQFIKDMIEWFKSGKTLPKRYVWEIVIGAYYAFASEQSLVTVDLQEGVTCDVIGDVHGQFYDMLHLYSLTDEPNENHYLLMNGDLVDRGSWSIEVILTAFAYKWLYPKFMYINRGNHEAKDMNRSYGFEGEAKHKHGEQSYKTVPLATLVSATQPPSPKDTGSSILSSEGLKRYFVVHGGLFSKDDVTLDEIRKLNRIGKQPGQEGLMCELLWTDPQELPGRGPSKRGVGIAFGPDVTRRWCSLNGVSGIIRSHEVRQDGYQVEHDGLCTTVFSAPNYVDQAGNKGAFIRIDSSGNQDYFQFDASPHPPMKPMAYVQGGLGALMM
ncbi:phosphoprotein phosphatase [Cyathus striatus]|nr:phosphoprotein phosphatase [Cyathus striatus]